MTTPKDYENEDWYLIANQDGLAIKIRNTVTLGEDVHGGLCLDGRDPAERWLTLAREGAQLIVASLAGPAQLARGEKWSTDAAGLVLARGTLLQFPHNEVYVSQSLHRGQIDMRVAVSFDAELAAAQAEEARAAAAAHAAATAPAQPAPKITTSREQEVGESGVIEVPEIPDDLRYTPTPYSRGNRRAVWLLSCTMLVLSAAVGLLLYDRYVGFGLDSPQVQSEPIESSAGLSQPPPVADVAAETASTDAAETLEAPAALDEPPVETAQVLTESELTAEPEPSDPFNPAADNAGVTASILPLDEAAAATPLSEPASTIPASPINVPLALDQAAALLANGYLTWPPEANAITLLRSVLAEAPDNQRALDLRDTLAETLLTEARAAHADGFEDSAERMLEQILDFHPEYGPALVVASRWRRI